MKIIGNYKLELSEIFNEINEDAIKRELMGYNYCAIYIGHSGQRSEAIQKNRDIDAKLLEMGVTNHKYNLHSKRD